MVGEFERVFIPAVGWGKVELARISRNHRSGDAANIYMYLLNNPLTRKVLSGMSKYCEKDGANRLEVALDLFVGARKGACLSCRVASSVIDPFLGSASRSFGSNKEQLRDRLKDPYWRRGLANVIRGIAWFGAVKPHVPGAPFQVVWNLTKACNLRCRHCYANAGGPAEDEMSTNDALRTIDILADAGVPIIAFSGGEPTARPDVQQLLGHARERGIFVAMATNAVLFSSRAKVDEFKQNGLQFAQISLDGANRQTHDSFRGVRGCYDKTIEGIKNCVAADLFVVIATTVTKCNYKEVPAIIDLAEKLGVNWFMMYNFVPTGRGRDMVEADLSPDEREVLLQMLWEQMKNREINVLSTAPQFSRIAQQCESMTYSDCNETILPTHFYNPSLPGDLRKLADFIGGCGAGRFYISLEPNGDIFPCVFFPRNEKAKLGNVLSVDFENMWRNTDLLHKLRNKDILKGKCNECTYRYTCGGCRARAYNYFEDVLAPDPGCVNNKTYWKDLESQIVTMEPVPATR